jgi:hypothetical protein
MDLNRWVFKLPSRDIFEDFLHGINWILAVNDHRSCIK